ncbi:MAG TPA: peptidylprolyl isomerase, partial [Vicinamibacteria bacterium]
HIYFSRDRRGDAVADDAAKALDRLRAEGNPTTFGDPIPMPEDFESVSGRDVAGLFGQEFARALTQMEVGQWTGPLESVYGVHLVFVREIVQGRVPELDEAREAVGREWSNARRREANDAFYQTFLERYTVSVEFPDWAQSSEGAP